MKAPAVWVWWRRHRWRPAVEGSRAPAVLDPRAWFWFLAQDLGRKPGDSSGPWGSFRRHLAIIAAGDIRRLRRVARDFNASDSSPKRPRTPHQPT